MNASPLPNLTRAIGVACFGFTLSLIAGLSPAAAQSTGAPQASSAAPASAAALPTADQILNHYIQASGGRDAWMKLTTRVSKGTVDIPSMNMSGTVEVHDKAPNMTLATVMIGGGSFVQGYDGKVAWSSDPQNGLRDLSDGELEETQRDADFYRPLDMKTLYKSITVAGEEKIGDRDTYVLAAGSEGGSPDKMYFDAKSGLLVRVVGQRHTPDGVAQTQIDFSDYRDVDGVKLPYSVQQSVGDVSYTINFSDVHHNHELDDAQFSKPAAQ